MSRPRCRRPWFSFPGVARGRTLLLSLPCIALAALGSGLCQRAVPGPDR